MGQRDLLSADERAKLFGIPVERDALARCYEVIAGSDVDVTPLVGFVAEQLKLPASGFDG